VDSAFNGSLVFACKQGIKEQQNKPKEQDNSSSWWRKCQCPVPFWDSLPSSCRRTCCFKSAKRIYNFSMGRNKRQIGGSRSKKKQGSLVALAKATRREIHQKRFQKHKELKRSKDSEAKLMKKRLKRARVPYAPEQTILLIGEGNFSFARFV
jgi:hypothetical protein